MDIRAILNKLDTVMVSEAITIKDVEAAVAGIKDEQERAKILNDIAWKEKLPGLYDPVSGYFVRKQSMPVGRGSNGQGYSIAATASSGADKELANLGLVHSSFEHYAETHESATKLAEHLGKANRKS
jgi:hypothetical protein